MKRILLTLAVLAALPVATASAGELSYSYVEGGYVNTQSDIDADGVAVNGSIAVSDSFHLFGGINNQELKDFDVDADTWHFGVGFNHSLNANTDLVARVAYQEIDVDAFGVSAGSNDGYFTEVGVRSALTDNLEGHVFAGYEDFEGVDGEFYARLGGQYKFNEAWGVVADVKLIDGDEQYFVGPRFSF